MSEPETAVSRWWWPGGLVAGAVAVVFAGLAVWGLAWGVPSRRRARLEGAERGAPKLPEGVAEQSWRHWGSHGRRSMVGKAFPRHLFNPVRSYHPDEYQVFKSLSHMRPRQLVFDPGNYIYPSLHTYVVGAALGACSLVGAVRLERGLDYYFAHPGALGRMYLVGRAVSVLAAVGALLLVWRLGEAMGRGTGLLAMGLLAAMPALAVHSHNLTRDTCAALVVAALFACCVRLARTGGARWFDLAGAAAGVCVGFQYFAAPLWLLVPTAALLHARREGVGGRQVAGRLAVSLVVMAAVVFVACPYHFLHADRFLADFASETGHVAGGGLVAKVASLAWATHVFRMMPPMLSWPLSVVVCVGLVAAVVRRRDADVLLLVWFVVWAGVVGFDGRTYSRYYVPLLPAMALLASRGLVAVGAAARRVVRHRWAWGAACAVVLAAATVQGAAMTWAWSRLYARENVRTLAGEWIAAHVPTGSRVGVTKWPWQFEMPPLDPHRLRLVVLEDSPRGDPHDLARLWAVKPDYFVTSSLQSGTIDLSDGCPPFWHFVLSSGELYRVCYEGRIVLSVFGRDVDLRRYPEDMRYVNPIIYVLERSVVKAHAADGRGTT